MIVYLYCITLDIDECESSPCVHGSCTMPSVNMYECDCTETGYTGDDCEIGNNGRRRNFCRGGGGGASLKMSLKRTRRKSIQKKTSHDEKDPRKEKK